MLSTVVVYSMKIFIAFDICFLFFNCSKLYIICSKFCQNFLTT